MVHLYWAVNLFNTLRSMSKVRPFKLVFLFEGLCFVQRGGRRVLVEPRAELEEVIDSVTAEGFLDFLDSPPTLQYMISPL